MIWIFLLFVTFWLGFFVGVWCQRRKIDDLEMDNFALRVEMMAAKGKNSA